MNLSQFLLTWGLVAGYAILNATGALLIKSKINQMGPISFDSWGIAASYFGKLFTSLPVIGGLGSIFIAAIIWIGALSRMDLSIAYPAGVALNFLIVLVFAFTMYHEALTLNKIIAACLIILSLYFLYRS